MSQISDSLDPQSAGITSLPKPKNKELDADFTGPKQKEHEIEPRILQAIAKIKGERQTRRNDAG